MRWVVHHHSLVLRRRPGCNHRQGRARPEEQPSGLGAILVDHRDRVVAKPADPPCVDEGILPLTGTRPAGALNPAVGPG
jgi:hypothetical protein